ncbi:hypothetical protein AB1286_32990 [Trinickia sp. NRRL B-1857]|uniref:hypothetical protein n=1 Tax=Trinickia sp. NRRL B-1857 TaxID=3162879 RepID=UPI003D28089F
MNDRALAALANEQQLDAVGGINLLGTGLGQRSWATAPTDENHVLDPLIDEVEKVIDGTTYRNGTPCVADTGPRQHAEHL